MSTRTQMSQIFGENLYIIA